jgi:alkanesulfonate monooxygenase SsuD/methylene tetrahydromethanopterin reductase-like flavin-dependent oxidoreductase (luciferase family)
MISIGWFGVGSGALSGPDGVAEIAQTAEVLGYESIWVGEHPVLVDPQAAPSPLPPDAELIDPVPVLA